MARGADADALALIQAEFDGSSPGGSEVLYRRKDDSEFWAGRFISPVRDEKQPRYSLSPEVGQFGAMHRQRYRHRREFEIIKKLGETAARIGAPPATLSPAWALANPRSHRRFSAPIVLIN